MSLIGRILAEPMCEVFAFMNWRDMNRYLTDETKWPGITRAFGSEAWKEVLALGDGRPERLRQIYTQALREKGRATFHCSFAMHGKNGQLIYWLFFASGSARGLEEMKKSMWKVDATGEFQFSDRHAGQLALLVSFNDDWLVRRMSDELAGKRLSVEEVQLWVLTETPCYLFNKALTKLERTNAIEVVGAPATRKKGSFKKYLNDPRVKVAFRHKEP